MHRPNTCHAEPACDEPDRWDRMTLAVGPRHRLYVAGRMALERALALVLLAITLPLLLLLAALSKLSSPGPAFYAQTRVGRRGRTFVMYKIRSMRHNCEAHTGPVWSGPDDPRVTAIGRLMRDTHLDELPQLVNVLRGEMSLIGPRPERPEVVARIERQIPEYARRLLMSPGLTGLAQVQLPADVDLRSVRQKLAYDLYYVREAGPGLDFRIMVSTALHLTSLALDAAARINLRGCRNAVEHELRAATRHPSAAQPEPASNIESARAVPVSEVAGELIPVAAPTMGVGFAGAPVVVAGDAAATLMPATAGVVQAPA